MEEIIKYFPNLSALQLERFEKLGNLYQEWNAKINLISRKDIDQLYIRHVLHSLAIAKILTFNSDAKVLDVGTGGGFPGIPLAILFDKTQFHLIDVIGKKIRVVQEVAHALNMNNVKAEQLRAENVKTKYDFVVSRAVTNMTDFVVWTQDKIATKNNHNLSNGILYLKGGDLSEELKNFSSVEQYSIADFFENPFFETKKVIYLPIAK
ncbi:MAG: 16S rRNA (guanine(527)-N(7))-methyltransferase RsmG [Bacteroidota bacterium]|nr:16S rRNA (guanine(527)-N(7))-methyltransferase RsmG [Bacteroidota bacterium]